MDAWLKKKMFRISRLLGFSSKDTFADISGHDDVKWAFDRALSSPDPIHILLKGPVGTGKTRFIKAIEKRYPELSYFALGSGATGAGMINQCFEIQPRFLLIDEIEDLRQSDQASLLSLMQDGVLTETKVSKTRRIELKCSVFATCNQLKRLRQPLLSRFMVIEIQPYSFEEFKRVTMDVVKHPLSAYIADQVWNSSDRPNIRDCVRIATISKCEQDVLRALRLMSCDVMT
jgi:holliday junction DNA helicase RuvB